MTALQTVRALWKQVTSGKGYTRVLKEVTIVSAGGGNCTAEMTVGEQHLNVVGTLHGGCTALIVDEITSFALISKDPENMKPSVSVNMNISYLKGALPGQTIVMEARTIKAGRTLAFLDIAIKNKATGETIATGTHTKFIVA